MSGKSEKHHKKHQEKDHKKHHKKDDCDPCNSKSHTKCPEEVYNLLVRNKLRVLGNAKFYDDVTVKGTTTLDGPLVANNQTTLNGTTVINGPTVVNGEVTFTGPINLPNPFNIPGDVNIGGKLTIEGGLDVLGAINRVFSKENPSYTIPADVFVDKHIFNVLDKQIGGETIETPFATAPLGDIENPPGNLTLGPLNLHITNPETVAPWFFRDLDGDNTKQLPSDPIGERVLYGGLWNNFAPGGGIPEPNPPIIPTDNTTTQIDITLNQLNTQATFDIFARFSTEPTFDFLFLILNGTTIANFDGHGPAPNDPYLAAQRTLSIKSGDVLSVQYFKDVSVYAGVDNIYFFLKNLKLTPVPAPTNLFVIRDNIKIFNFANVLNLDNITNGKVILDFQYLKGDILLLDFDQTVYNDFVLRYIGTT